MNFILFAFRLHIITENGNYMKRSFGWKVHNSNAVADYNGSVCCIDGSKL